jgi:hypothetical protein
LNQRRCIEKEALFKMLKERRRVKRILASKGNKRHHDFN